VVGWFEMILSMSVKNKSKRSAENDYLIFLAKEKTISDNIINNSRSMISIINRNYVYEKVNTTFCNALRTVSESIIGKSLNDVWGSAVFENKIKPNIDLCFAGKTIRYEASFDTPQYSNRHFDVVFRPFIAESGNIAHLIVETYDINDLASFKKTASEKEQELRKIETNLPIGFLRCDTTGKILHANQAFLKIVECTDETAIINMNLRNFYPEGYLFDMQFDQLIECHVKAFGRFMLKNCTGKEIPCRISGFLALDESGAPSFIDFAVEDSTRELILENRLLQAQKLETIGALAGGIAHDFNNILATISGYAEMLREDLPENSLLSEKVSKIQGAVLKAQSITNQILTFSRQVEQEKIHISVSEVLKETIGFVKSAAPSNILIESRIPKRNAFILADPTQLFRVFLNLMTNAIQAMEDKGGTLTVGLEVVKGKFLKQELNKDIIADEYVLVTFKDTGTGMEPSLLSRVFEPFFTTREVGKGSGLGLSVTHGIITEMEGEIIISSKKEEGSIFYVSLPVSKIYGDNSGIDVKKKKILFITGNEHESRILSLAIESTGNDLIYVSDKSHLLKTISADKNRPDLVIYMSDSIQIQQKDLVGIYNKLKINIPCILISDPNTDLLQEKLINSGIIEQHLIKPVSLKEIRNAIRAVFN